MPRHMLQYLVVRCCEERHYELKCVLWYDVGEEYVKGMRETATHRDSYQKQLKR